ncbi:MAG: radical SAM protein [Fibrobacteria bacterium]
MTKRFIKNVWKRAKHLPLGADLVRYTANKAQHVAFKATGQTKVAHPSTVMLELSARCNLKCTICPREHGYGEEMDMGLMEEAQARKIVDELVPYVDSIGLTGMGETLMYRKIDQMVDYIKSKNQGIVISISTNAVLPKAVEKVAQMVGKLDTIQISIDGIGEVYNAIRIQSDFELFKKNVRQIADMCRGTTTTVMLNMVVTKENHFHMTDVVQFAEDMGIGFVNFAIFNLACISGTDISYYDFFQGDAFKAEVQRLKDHKTAVETTWTGLGNEKGFQTCTLPWGHFYVCWNGEMAPCCAKPFPKELSFGNVFEQGLMPVLNGPSFREFRRKWLANETPDFCKKCHFIDCKKITI